MRNTVILDKSLALVRKERDALQTSYDTLQRSSRPAGEHRALEAEIELLREEKAASTLLLEQSLERRKAVTAEIERLKKENDNLRVQIEDLEDAYGDEEEQRISMEHKYKDLLQSFNAFKKRLRKMGNE